MTVIEDGSYIGEAMLETIKPDEERVIPFSVELGCKVRTEAKADLEDVHRARIVNGHLYLSRFRVHRTTYAIANNTDRAIDLFLDHRFRPRFELVDTPDPIERTDNYQRFRFDLPARETTTFVVTEKGEEHDRTQISAADGETYGIWLRNGYINETTYAALAEIAALTAEVAELRRQVHVRETQIEEIFKNQGRLRENLGALGSAANERSLRDRYIAELASEEDRLAELRKAIKELTAERETKENSVRERIAALTFDSLGR
jgi:hypothetical protein